MDEFRRGWTIVLGAAIGTAFGISALPFYTLGVFVKPVGAEFGWDRATVQSGFSAQMLALVVVGWAYGLAIDRFGPRRVALASIVGLALGFAAVATTTGLAHWYLGWALVALLGGGTSPIAWTRGVADWFDKARGAALGLALVGTGLTGLVAPPLLVGLIEVRGWRAGYWAMAAALLLVALPLVALLFRDRAGGVTTGTVPPREGLSPREALRSYRFAVLLIVFFAITFCVGGIIPNLVPLFTDGGLTPAEAAGVASLAGLAVIVGRVAAGFLIDRFWAPGVALAFLAAPALACLILAQPVLPPGPMLALAALSVGLAAGAEFDLIAFLVSRYFGMRHYGLIYSLQMVAMLLAGGLAPPVFGRFFDATGSYAAVLWPCAAVFLAAPLLLLTLGRYPDRRVWAPAPA